MGLVQMHPILAVLSVQALLQPMAAALPQGAVAISQLIGAKLQSRQQSQSQQQPFPLAAAPPCVGPFDPNVPLFVPGKTTPNICFLDNKDIRFDLTCNDKQFDDEQLRALNWTLNYFHGVVSFVKDESGSNTSSLPIDGNPFYETKCEPLNTQEGKHESASAGQPPSIGQPQPCMEVRLVEVPNAENKHVTIEGVRDMLSTILSIPDILHSQVQSRPLECRVDVKTASGLHFGEGCFQWVENYDSKNPTKCPNIPKPLGATVQPQSGP